jgi:prolyl 4-hydroxylase
LTGEGDVIENGIHRSRSKKSSNADVADGLDGGATTFPRAITTEFHDGVKIQPQSGKAVLFYNVLPDGNMDDLSQHSGGKVESGVKYVANIWIWDPIIS